MRRMLVAAVLAMGTPVPALAQDETTVIDSVVVVGAQRNDPAVIATVAAFPVGMPSSFRDVQRSIAALYATGQFKQIRASQATIDGRQVLRFTVEEQPLLTNWTVRGVRQLSERKVRGKVRLLAGRPFDPQAAVGSVAAIDSLYEDEGYYLTQIELRELPQADGNLRVVFDVDEGRRVTISRVVIEGNESFSDGEVVGNMRSKPEGFWWFRKGEYSDVKVEEDIREKLPAFYGAKGFVDFQVLSDSLDVDPRTGKGTLILEVDEGESYLVGGFEVVGNRHFTAEQLERFFPFERGSGGFLGLGGVGEGPVEFDQARWDEASENVRNLYRNNGYIYAQVLAPIMRRTDRDGRKFVDLRWQIIERQPAIVNKVLIRGNTITHEDVIRRAISVVPGDVVRQSALIQSYQAIQNLGFFEEPLPVPETEQANQQGDVNIIFTVAERHTGNINFGASVGQGTGLGGFIGLTEPNLFGRAKRASFQWQFGRNINDVNVSYTDPALRGSLTSATVSAHNSRVRFTVADLGRIRSRGGSLTLGFPVRGSRFTRLQWNYLIEQSDYDSPTLRSRFTCDNCVLSSMGLALVRDTRIELPFPTGGSLHRVGVSQNGGPLGGSGNFRRATFEGRWYAPITSFGSDDPLTSPMKLVLALSSQAGFIWGDPGPHFRQLFSMGGVQFGIPLRGYDEFSITPQGFDPRASGSGANTVDAFGASYFQASGEVGLRLSQMVYLATFVDAGNVWARPREFNPTRLFRGIGVGVSLISPLGPIGLDYAYGFDRTDLFGNLDPGWQFHFRLGNIF